MQKFISDKKTTLTRFLTQSYNGALSYGRLMQLYRDKDVKVNGVRVRGDVDIDCGDVVECYFDAQPLKIEVVYQDENLIICNKGVRISAEQFYAEVKKAYPSAIFTHRLDTNTSGIMVFALNQTAYQCLYEGFKKRSFKKYYHCLVNGFFQNKSGELCDYLFKDAKKGEVKVYPSFTKGAKIIKTGYREVARGTQSSVLKVELITGRTHQIRAHLAYYGHFIIGDGKYGIEKINRAFGASGQLLISSELVFAFDGQSPLNYLDGRAFTVSTDRVFERLK